MNNPPTPEPNTLGIKSETSSSPWLDCQVCHDTRRINVLTKDMVKLIRKLRRDLKACPACSVDMDACPILLNLNSQMQSAIQAVVDEWNLSA